MSSKSSLFILLFVLFMLAPMASAQGTTATGIVVPTPGESCFLADQHPQIELVITPADQVRIGRVFFHSALDNSFFYVNMQRQGDRFVGVLPKPKLEAGPVTYYVEVDGLTGGAFSSPQVAARVVGRTADCPEKMAAIVPPPAGGVLVASMTGAGAPLGFTGIATAAGAAAASGGGLGAFLTSTAGVAVVGGAGAIGITAAIVAADDKPASPSQ